ATIFVTSIWLRANRDAAAELAADPLFSIQAHGAAHKPASVSGRKAYGIRGTGSVTELVEEVEGNARAIEAITGKRPRWYRSGTAHYDATAVAVIHRMGFRIAGFSRNGDEGATLPPDGVRDRILAANDRDIILCHVNRPRSGTAKGLRAALPALLDAGVIFVFLPEN
ncbi:polysaccharide deacetylase family protein, partial [Desulfovibrio sp. OttesenSCG-928-I05]|nr:polysaccharide deacetylase family protein [Desulfovibrio sp. OttesenSCG-928-I05]